MSLKTWRTILILTGILVLIGTPVTVWLLHNRQQNKIAQYHQPVNEEGFAVDMRDNPYFKTKQPGYRYKAPETITYFSEVTETKRHAMLFFPADYDPGRSYPVLYLLHGMGGSHVTWRNKNADVIIQNAYYFQKATEMIVVCVNSNVNAGEDTDNMSVRDLTEAYDKTGEDLVNDLMPYMEKHYPVKTGKENTAIAGYSMGGRNTIGIAFTHQDLFGYVGAFSSASMVKEMQPTGYFTPLIDSLSLDEKAGGFKLLLLVVGRSDNVCGYVTYDLDRYMTDKKIPHMFYDTEGKHENQVWQNALYNFVNRIFK